jgi:hypothetical protein
MGDGIEPLVAEQFIHPRLVEKVGLDEPRRGRDGVRESVFQAIERYDVVPFGNQLLGYDAANEPGSASYQHFHSILPEGSIASLFTICRWRE